MAKTLYFRFLSLLALLLLSGCAIYPGEQIADQFAKEFVGGIEDTAELSMVAILYYTDKDEWPDSVKTLQLFCAEKKDECPKVEWPKYSNTSFVTLPDGRLKIEHHESEDSGNIQGKKLDVVVTLSKPVTKAEATSMAWDALRADESEEVANRYHIEEIDRSQESWHILFRGPDAGVLGDDFLVIVNDDKTVKVLPGE
jgi:hypothetical protein